MKNRKLQVIISFLLLIIIPSISNALAIENQKNQIHENFEIIVDKNNDNYFTSIQEALDSAQEGSTIYIKSGKYNEIININKKINIIGESKEKTLINPKSKENSYAIKISAEQINLSNIGIQNKGPGLYTTGIKINANKTTIHSCDIFNTPVGIAIWSSRNTISKCNFFNCSDEGIAILGSKQNKANYNEIYNCEFYNNCDGIELQYSSNNKITSCIFYQNTHAGIDAILKSNNNNTIDNCNFIENKAFGIFISNSEKNIITNCNLSKNKITAILSEDIKIEKCDFDSIDISEKSSITLDNCSDFKKSKINTVNSNYKIINNNKIIKSFYYLKERRDAFLSKIYNIISLLQ